MVKFGNVEFECAPLPDDGQRIQYKDKTGEWREGVVLHCWLCMDEPAIKLTCGASIFPELGNPWKPI